MEAEEKNEDPSLVFTKSVMGQIQKEDVLSMVLAQREMLMRYEKTNEMLLNFNMLSGNRYETTMLEFRKHTTLLYEMKKDLDTIFRRIRVLKNRLSSLHPEAFSACSDVYDVLEEKTGEKGEDGEVEKTKSDASTVTEDAECPVTNSEAESKDVLQDNSAVEQTGEQVTEKEPAPPNNT